MPDKKLTDNEIIKALECCTTNGVSCKNCPAFVKVDRSNCKKYFRGALDLINRQKAEIERLHSILLSFTDEVHTWSNKKGYDTTELSLISILGESKNIKANIKAEAYKEFAEILKEHKCSYDLDNYHSFEAVEINIIDEILREKAGDDDA